MVSYFIALYFMLWMAVHLVRKSHERRPGGRSREEALSGDDKDEKLDGGRS